jgi:hypothetical protein
MAQFLISAHAIASVLQVSCIATASSALYAAGVSQDQANSLGYAGSLVWAVRHLDSDTGGYVFSYTQDGATAVKSQYAYAASKVGGELHCFGLLLGLVWFAAGEEE